uniref:RNase H type-1 domain-containing protein n=1 Tax=Cannabis sativa TaxID=3483 RepID=A0A803NUP3_CANSA
MSQELALVSLFTAICWNSTSLPSGNMGTIFRLRVMFDVAQPSLAYPFTSRYQQLFVLELKYENLPDICFFCGRMGHSYNKGCMDYMKACDEAPFPPELSALFVAPLEIMPPSFPTYDSQDINPSHGQTQQVGLFKSGPSTLPQNFPQWNQPDPTNNTPTHNHPHNPPETITPTYTALMNATMSNSSVQKASPTPTPNQAITSQHSSGSNSTSSKHCHVPLPENIPLLDTSKRLEAMNLTYQPGIATPSRSKASRKRNKPDSKDKFKRQTEKDFLEEIEKPFSAFLIKPPHPDGFNSNFYKVNWSSHKNDILKAAANFLNENGDITPLNTTLITLIPKAKQPTTLYEYRPIGLCNTIYKVISKTIANRLKLVLNNLISPNQSAFLPDRLISDNIIIAQEVAHSIKLKTRGKKVGWRSNLIWPKLLTEWNGHLLMLSFKNSNSLPTLPIWCSPASPRLLSNSILMVSPLFRFKERDKSLPALKSPEGPTISHLLFADDSFLFCQASINSCNAIKEVLEVITLVSLLLPLRTSLLPPPLRLGGNPFGIFSIPPRNKALKGLPCDQTHAITSLAQSFLADYNAPSSASSFIGPTAQPPRLLQLDSLPMVSSSSMLMHRFLRMVEKWVLVELSETVKVWLWAARQILTTTWGPIATLEAVALLSNSLVHRHFLVQVIETDCKSITDALHHHKEDLSVFSDLISQIKETLSLFPAARIAHIKRNANSLADKLAHWASGLDEVAC